MSYIKQLTHFFSMASQDNAITPTHISLFMALFQHWNKSRFPESIQVIRDDVMRLSKINSKATYHRSMAFLDKAGYIKYTPSYNPYKGSMIIFFPAESKSNVVQLRTKDEPVQILTTRLINEPINKLYSNTIIKNNSITTRAQKKDIVDENFSQVKKEKSCAKKEKEIPPKKEHVMQFFIAKGSDEIEAQKFINHYTANGWLVGGKTPMQDWQASARNWISNAAMFGNRNYNNRSERIQTSRSGQLNTTTKKDYFEPL